MHNIIGQNVRKLRKARSWTQEHLAQAVNVTARTVQRIESGEYPPSADTLLGLASALEVDVEVLRRTPEEQTKADAELLQAVKDFEQRYDVVEMQRVERGSKLGSLLSSIDALCFDNPDLANEAEEDAVVCLKGLLSDCLDFWKDFPEDHRDIEKDLQSAIDTLQELKLIVTAGVRPRRMQLKTGDTTPFTWQVLYVQVARETDAVGLLVLDKKAPVRIA